MINFVAAERREGVADTPLLFKGKAFLKRISHSAYLFALASQSLNFPCSSGESDRSAYSLSTFSMKVSIC